MSEVLEAVQKVDRAAETVVLEIDPARKAAALAIIRELRFADAAVLEARCRGPAGHAALVAARRQRAALKKGLGSIYLRAPEAVEAAEREFAAGQ